MSTANLEVDPDTWTKVANAGEQFALRVLTPTQVYAELATTATDSAPAAELRGQPAHERLNTRTEAGNGYAWLRTDRPSLIALNIWSP